MSAAEHAAKLVLQSPEGIILPYGASGRLNLPGGGVEADECPIDTLARELDEELGYPLGEVEPLWVKERQFYVTDKFGRAQKRIWSIFMASTDMCAADFMYGDDIQGVAALRREQLYGHPQVTRSAKIATALAYRAIQSRRR